MNSFVKIYTLAAAIIFTAGTAAAEDEKKSPWDGNIDVNALFTSGNSSQTSFGIAGKTKYTGHSTSHTFSAFADFNKSSGITDRERFGAAYNFTFDFSSRMFFSLDTSFESNKFGAFRERFASAAGIGYRLKNTDTLSWTIEAAPSMLLTKNLEGADSVSEFAAFARSAVEWQITDTTKFTNTTSAYLGGRSIVEVKSAFDFKILESITSKFSYDILYDRDAPLGRKSTDTIARVGLSYGF